MPWYAYVVLGAGLVSWFVPFLRTGWNFRTAQRTDRRARWGMLVQAVGYSLLWPSAFWSASPGGWRTALCIAFLLAASVLSWTATRALGSQLRLDAALGADHELVRRGPYRFLRHPIYASMLCVEMGTGFMISPGLLFAGAILVFLAGTEIRVRIEDRLLASRFGEEFLRYQGAVRAYVPFVR